jgi:hypothetical protein
MRQILEQSNESIAAELVGCDPFELHIHPLWTWEVVTRPWRMSALELNYADLFRSPELVGQRKANKPYSTPLLITSVWRESNTVELAAVHSLAYPQNKNYVDHPEVWCCPLTLIQRYRAEVQRSL